MILDPLLELVSIMFALVHTKYFVLTRIINVAVTIWKQNVYVSE